jgi:hypothetical protein
MSDSPADDLSDEGPVAAFNILPLCSHHTHGACGACLNV